jgi:hypothetical protein
MAAPHLPEPQNKLVAEIATVILDYRDTPEKFVKFELMCGLTLKVEPIAGRIRVTPRAREEQFRCKDAALKASAGTDRDAFFAAVETFARSAALLAWNGETPAGDFQMVRELSGNFAYPTMSVELGYRRRGDSDEYRANMVFIGFPDGDTADSFAAERAHLIK